MNHIIFIDRFLESLIHKKKPGTIKQYKSDLKQVTKWLDLTNSTLLDINDSDLSAYMRFLQEKRYSKGTIKRHMSTFNQLIKFNHLEFKHI